MKEMYQATPTELLALPGLVRRVPGLAGFAASVRRAGGYLARRLTVVGPPNGTLASHGRLGRYFLGATAMEVPLPGWPVVEK
jgi:hypothetical protein